MVKGAGREFTISLVKGAKTRHRKYTLQAQSVEAQKSWVGKIASASANVTSSDFGGAIS